MIAADMTKRFDLSPNAGMLTTESGYLIMKIRFSASTRRDRPRSSTLRLVDIEQKDDGVDLRVTLRNRYVRNVMKWFDSKKE